MERGEIKEMRRKKIEKWVMGGRGKIVKRINKDLIGLREGDGEKIRMKIEDKVRI